MTPIHVPPTIGGLTHARNVLAKRWFKERQRNLDLHRRNQILREEIKRLRASQ